VVLEITFPIVVKRRQVVANRERRVLLQHRRHMARRRRVIQLGMGRGKKRMLGGIGYGNALESVDRLAILPRHLVGPAEMTPESLGMKRIEAHGLLDPLDAVLGLAQPGQNLTLLNDDEVVVGIEVQGAPLVITRLVEITAGQVHRGEYPMDIAVVVIQGEREPQVLLGLVPGFVAVGAPAMNPRLGQGTSPPGMGVGAFGVELDGPIQQALDLLLSTLVER
jgi:hypothetical protein